MAFEQQESYDDNFLPDATELAKYKGVDPIIVTWLMDKASEEQIVRHKSIDRKISLLEVAQKQSFHTDYLTILCAFVLMMAGMSLSYILLQANQTIAGSIFGGGTMLFAARAVLGFRRSA